MFGVLCHKRRGTSETPALQVVSGDIKGIKFVLILQDGTAVIAGIDELCAAGDLFGTECDRMRILTAEARDICVPAKTSGKHSELVDQAIRVRGGGNCTFRGGEVDSSDVVVFNRESPSEPKQASQM